MKLLKQIKVELARRVFSIWAEAASTKKDILLANKQMEDRIINIIRNEFPDNAVSLYTLMKGYLKSESHIFKKKLDECPEIDINGANALTLIDMFQKAGVSVNMIHTGMLPYDLWEQPSSTLIYRVTEVYQLLADCGYRLFRSKKEGDTVSTTIVRVQDNIVEQVLIDDLISTVFEYIRSIPTTQRQIDDLLNVISKGSGTIFTKHALNLLPELKGQFNTDSKNEVYLYFLNHYCRISKGKVDYVPYKNLPGLIWKSQIIEHDIFEPDQKKAEFADFVDDVCSFKEGVLSDRVKSLQSILGYMISEYKTPALVKAVILMDSDLDDEPQGGTGKGILIKALKKVRKISSIDGKHFNTSANQFSFSTMELDTKIFVIDDVRRAFSFEDLFSVLTEGVLVNRKYQQPFFLEFERSPKFLFTTNYVVYGTGESHDRRKCEFELSDYYGSNRTPEQKFGHLFFNDWDEAEWNRFYQFMISCIQLYLNKGLMVADPIHIAERHLIQSTTPEFIALMEGVPRDKEFLKRDILKDYNLNVSRKGEITQRRFTGWVRLYCTARNLDLRERKSREKYYFAMFNK